MPISTILFNIMCIKQGRFHAPAYCYQSIHLSGLSLFLFRFGLCCSFLWSTIAWLSLSFCKMLVLAFSAISGFLVLSHHSLNVLKAFGTQKRPGTFVPSLLKSAIADDYLFENCGARRAALRPYCAKIALGNPWYYWLCELFKYTRSKRLCNGWKSIAVENLHKLLCKFSTNILTLR